MDIRIIIAALLSFVVAVAIGPFFIKQLTKLKMAQTEREDGVKAHLAKAGTPTMGGVIIILALLAGTVWFIPSYPVIAPVLVLTLGFGIIGFIDDYLKVVKKHPDGLKAGQKMLLQIVVTAIFAVLITAIDSISLFMRIPFVHEPFTIFGHLATFTLPYQSGVFIDFGWFAYVILFFAVIGTVNGTNFTDGLDGLASSVTAVIAAFFTIAAMMIFGDVAPLGAAMAGALMGFLVYNAHPAKIFMGDTGSLALGGFVIGTAYALQMTLFVLIIGLIYIIEVLSVMIQVTYFKKTGGKRVFKMAPIHHHFELSGWSETKIVTVFTIITVFLCLIALYAI